MSQTPDNFHSEPVANKLVETRPVYNQPPEQTRQEYATYQFSPSDAGVLLMKKNPNNFPQNKLNKFNQFEAPAGPTPEWEVYWDVPCHPRDSDLSVGLVQRSSYPGDGCAQEQESSKCVFFPVSWTILPIYPMSWPYCLWFQVQ